MGLFDHFPYTNVHELNLDWVLSMMKALEAEWEAFIAGNSLQFADPMLHDISKTYAKNTIVLDGIGNAYVSLQAVPVGVGLQNGDYWLMVFDYEAFIEKVNKNFTARYYRGSYRATAAMAIGDWLTVDDVLCKATAAIAADDVLEVGVNIEHFTLEDFIKAFMQSANQLIQQYKNDIDASELAYRQQLAQDIANTTASLQAQLDAAIAGVTVDSEVINARVGYDGTTYPTLHDAIVSQVDTLFFYIRTITNFVRCGNFTRNASASVVQLNDINEGEKYRIYVNEIYGMDTGNPKLFMLKPDNTFIEIYPTKTGTDYLYFEVTVPSGGYDRLRIYANKDPNAVTCHCRYGWVMDVNGMSDLIAHSINDMESFLSNHTLSITSISGIENITDCGDFSSNASAAIANWNVSPGEKYRIYTYNASGMDTDNPKVYLFRADDTFYGAGSGTEIAGAKYWDITVPSDIVRMRLYANKDAGSPTVSCSYAIVKEVGTIGDVNYRNIEAVDKFTKTFNKLTFKIFKKVVCCGDSYTAGYIHLTGESPVTINEDYAWPHYLETMSGNEYVNCGASGATSLSWLSSSRGLIKAQASGRSQAYILGLMVNDIATSVPLGTSADIGTDSPTTYYGGISKIIRELNSISSDAKIFVCTCPRNDGQFPTYNAAIRDIVSIYEGTYPVYLLDLQAHYDLYRPIIPDFLNGHYTALGYEQFAEVFAYLISQYIVDNYSDFQDVFKLPYD